MNGSKGETTVQEPSRAQRSIARRAAESRATIPYLELSSDVEIGPDLLGDGRSLIAVLTRASALALREVPRGNSSYRDGRFELHERINVGVIVPTADAFAIPTVFDADAKEVGELTTEIEVLAARAQSGELLASELSGATITVSEVGATRAAPLIVPPQAAALGAGAVRDVPVVRDAAIVPGQMVTVTLACDHRILYGNEASRLLAAVSSRLEGATL